MKMKKNALITLVFCLLIFTAAAQPDNKRFFQLSFISPLGTNGMQSHFTTNVVSLNILGGHSYGNTAFEFASIYNVNMHLTKGFQFAGITNYSGNAHNAAQFAGVTNITVKGRMSFQFSGVVNVADEIAGVQFAGVANHAKNVGGIQFSGVYNASNILKGCQLAGVINYATDAKGLQLAGILNISKEVSGVQLAGIVNVSKRVEGVQLGLINYAEESDGVSIGLINVVKKGGKREFEVAFSEALNTSVSFKLGTDKFYTIFSGGVNYLSNTIEYAAGLGFGTHIDWKKGWGNQIEALGYSLTENSSFATEDINMLTQLKFTVSKEIARHFKVFAGPVLNMTISKYIDAETGILGSSLPVWSVWKNKSETTRLNAWIGFSAGVRF